MFIAENSGKVLRKTTILVKKCDFGCTVSLQTGVNSAEFVDWRRFNQWWIPEGPPTSYQYFGCKLNPRVDANRRLPIAYGPQ